MWNCRLKAPPPAHTRSTPSQLPEIREQRGALLWQRRQIEVHAVGRDDGRQRRARWRVRPDELEELEVMIDHILERRRAVVVEVWSRPADAPYARRVELVPVVERRRTHHEPGQQRTPGIGAREANRRAVGFRDLIEARVARQARRTGGETPPAERIDW